MYRLPEPEKVSGNLSILTVRALAPRTAVQQIPDPPDALLPRFNHVSGRLAGLPRCRHVESPIARRAVPDSALINDAPITTPIPPSRIAPRVTDTHIALVGKKVQSRCGGAMVVPRHRGSWWTKTPPLFDRTERKCCRILEETGNRATEGRPLCSQEETRVISRPPPSTISPRQLFSKSSIFARCARSCAYGSVTP